MNTGRAQGHVAVFGGGIGGLSAAQELAERGFRVTVYERNHLLGGKARSMDAPGSGAGHRKGLPAEHGFRFFPGFYRHIDDLLPRIPFRGNPDGVLGNLISTDHWYVADASRQPLRVPARLFSTKTKATELVALAVRVLRGQALGIPPRELAWFVWRCLILLTSCDERLYDHYESLPWLDFFKGGKHSAEFERYVLAVLPLIFVACKADQMSARTGGMAFLRLCAAALAPGRTSARVLNAPTNEAWIDPWIEHLMRQGVRFHLGTRLRRLECDGYRLTGALLEANGHEFHVTADHYIAAVPADVMSTLLTPELARAAPELEGIRKLKTEWMVGLQFYLDRDLPIVRGHTLLLDSPWMLTTISQEQFWPDGLRSYGDGKIQGVLSVIISDWTKEGVLFGKPASACTKDELKDEIFAQLKMHLRGQARQDLEQLKILAACIELPRAGSGDANEMHEPYLVNTVGSWAHRPGAVTAIPNLFLAADYVRTHTDLATMEGANEAARRAVNGILDAAQVDSPRCPVWAFERPLALEPFIWLDRWLYKRGLQHLFETKSSGERSKE